MDVLAPAERSGVMAKIRGRNTRPERIVRSLLTSMGKRYRLHRAGLPGRPDIVLPGPKKVIFVHGCFWHRHSCAKGSSEPKSNATFWSEKLRRNRERDRENVKALRRQGWDVLVVWECQLRDNTHDKVVKRLRAFVS